MYSLFFHLSGLALIEIIFYFMYVGPMETQVFKHAIEHAGERNYVDDDNNIVPPVKIINPFNISQTFEFGNNLNSKYSNHLQDKAKKGEEERKQYNKNLYDQALTYWTYLMIFSIAIFCTEFSIKYYLFLRRKKKNNNENNVVDNNQQNTMPSVESLNSLEMTTIEHQPLRNRLRIDSLDEEDNNAIEMRDEISDEIPEDENKFIEWAKIRKIMLRTAAYNTTLAGLVLSFEFLFFTTIVLKYKIISVDELSYSLYNILNSIIYHFVKNDMKIIIE